MEGRPRMAHLSARRLARTVTALALGTLPLIAAGSAAAAPGEQPVRLSVKPVGTKGSYFNLTLKPGETRRLTVQLGNHSTTKVQARTYTAEAYTIINGGFGAKLAGETSGGTAKWVAYPSGVITLPARRSVQRSFTVTVPRGTKPGEYIAGVVIENATPVKGKGAIALNQVIRTAIAVAVRVPGPLKGKLAIGAASHKLAGANSVVNVAVRNTGNRLLKPLASFAVKDSKGKTVTASTVQMDSFYAGTATAVELPLAAALNPGDYTVSLTLTDRKRRTSATAVDLPMRVEKPAAAKDAHGAGGKLAGVLQDRAGGLPVGPIASGLVALLLVAAGVVVLRRRRGHDRAHTPAGHRAAQPPVPAAPVPSAFAELAAVPAAASAPPAEQPLPAAVSGYTVRDILPGK